MYNLCGQRIDVSHNSGRSKTVFLPFSRLKTTLFDRKSPICFEGFCRISNGCGGLRRISFDWHSPQVPTENRPNATKNRPNATKNRPSATFLCHFATLLRHSVHIANSDLRQIACDFLTAGNRVGWSNFHSFRSAGAIIRHSSTRFAPDGVAGTEFASRPTQGHGLSDVAGLCEVNKKQPLLDCQASGVRDPSLQSRETKCH